MRGWSAPNKRHLTTGGRVMMLVALQVVVGAALGQAATTTLHLADAERLTLEHQPALRQALASEAVYGARSDETMALLLPTVNATGQFVRSQGSFARAGSTGTGGFVSGSAAPSNFLSLGLNASQPLWDFGAIQRFRASGRTFEATQATRRAVTLQVLLTTRRTFFAARANQALMGVAEEALANQHKHLAQVEQFVKAGLHTGIDVATTQTLVANAQLQLVNAKNAYRLSRAQLRQAIGWAGLGEFEIAPDDLGPNPFETRPLDELVARALANRPEVFAARTQVEAQALTVSAQHGGYLPTLLATGAVSEAGTDPAALGTNWSFGATLAWNLFQGGNTAATVREARATADFLGAQLDLQLIQVRVDVESARFTVEDEQSAILAATAARDSAKAQLSLAEGRYAQGVGSILELSDAQVQAVSAAAQLVRTQLALSTARAQLLGALGELP